MLSNLDIKRKEIFKATQKLIKINGEMKQVTAEFIHDLNECARSEYKKENALLKSIKMARFKKSLKVYFKVFAQKSLLEEDIERLKAWQPPLEESDNGK